MKHAIVMLVCLVVLAGCGGSHSGTGPIDEGVKVSGTFTTTGGNGGGWEFRAYEQGHAGDPDYLVGGTDAHLDTGFEFSAPDPGVYDIDLVGATLPSHTEGAPCTLQVWLSWRDVQVGEAGYDMGTVVVNMPVP